MERTLISPHEELQEEEEEEEDYIDMDISSTSFLCYSVSSPPYPREFEFQIQMSSNPPQREATTFPADELFYKGKLLPLHLPPRLQMVQKLLENSTLTVPHEKGGTSLFEENVLITNTSKDTAASTPFESCNISPATSCYVSGELSAEDYFFECSVQLDTKKSWSKKFKLIRQSSLGHKLKASRLYLQSLFNKSGSSNKPTSTPKEKKRSNKILKLGKRNQIDKIQKENNQVAESNASITMRNISEEKISTGDECSHRSSFSGFIKWHSRTKSLSTSSSHYCSSSSSSSANGLNGPQVLRRSSSVNSDAESSIQGAIAYCKMSHQLVGERKSASDIGFYASTASRIASACENQERPRLCRG